MHVPHDSTTARARFASRRGGAIGIIVLLIAVVIILYLMFGMSTGGGPGGSSTGGAGYVGQALNSRQTAKQTAFSINTQQLTILIANYRQQNNKLPTTVDDLESPGAFRDQWGNTMSFTCAEDRGSEGVTVTFRSAGPDGEMGNEDDITSTGRLPF